jgi:hypothetical protein
MKRSPKGKRKLPKGKRISLLGTMLRTTISKSFVKKTQLKESDFRILAIYRSKAKNTFVPVD